jgi:hypothetical protein
MTLDEIAIEINKQAALGTAANYGLADAWSALYAAGYKPPTTTPTK